MIPNYSHRLFRRDNYVLFQDEIEQRRKVWYILEYSPINFLRNSPSVLTGCSQRVMEHGRQLGCDSYFTLIKIQGSIWVKRELYEY